MSNEHLYARVFVIQQPAKHEPGKGFVPKYDLTPAEQFGQLVFLLPPGGLFRENMGRAVVKLREGLSDFTRHDYILALGDPFGIATAVMLAAKAVERAHPHIQTPIKLLRWDRHRSAYESYSITG